MSQPVVLCAVDLGSATTHVLYHAVGLARVMTARLKIVHVAAEASAEVHQRVWAECVKAAPYQSPFDEDDILVRTGPVAEALELEAAAVGATLLVMGSLGHGTLARWLLGSNSDAVLRETRTPVLLVPPIDMDIVSVGDGAALTCGPVLAAVDLNEDSRHQLQIASRMAGLARQSLLLLTVARDGMSNHDASQLLRDRAHGLSPVKPTALIVRTGDVAEEISRCAVTEGTGLVVMGLREPPRGRPGAIASAVLKTGRAFVLAVPDR